MANVFCPPCNLRRIVGPDVQSLNADSSLNSEPITYDSSMVARRCMPYKPIKPRRILDIDESFQGPSRFREPPTLSCSCEKNDVCAVCTGRRERPMLTNYEGRRQREIIELMDHSYHKSLATPEGNF